MKRIFLAGYGTMASAIAQSEDSGRYILINYVTPTGVVFEVMDDAVRLGLHKLVERDYAQTHELTQEQCEFRWEPGAPNDEGGFTDFLFSGSADDNPVGAVVVDVRQVHTDIVEFLHDEDDDEEDAGADDGGDEVFDEDAAGIATERFAGRQ